MQQTEVFDKAKWHFDADNFPPQLDAYQGYIHTGYYIGWLAKKGFLNMEEMPDLQHSIDLLEKNSISPVAIYREMMDGVFSSDDIIPQILSFTREYFDFDRGDYLRDYEVALGAGLPSLYYVKDTTENFGKIFLVIEESYNGWLRDRFFSGRWVGQFVYGDEYPEDIRGTVVPFVIEFIVKDGLVKGKCTDLENDVLQPEATIEGFIEHNSISFLKKYADLLAIDKVGDLTNQKDMPDIHYFGEYIDGEFTGEWEIEWIVKNEQGELEEYLDRGTWQMHQE